MEQTDIFTVCELNRAIKALIEPNFNALKVRGEVSNVRLQSSGHEYFTLKDDKASVSCVLFKGYRSRAAPPLKVGDKVTVEGDLSLYEPRGQYQIVVKKVSKAGVGDLLMQIHALKKELEEKGWLAKENKKPLPAFPKRIGVITSPTGSVIQDILHVLSRRFSGFNLLLSPAKVQGPGAAEEIARAIDEMNTFNLSDVLIIGRGGGSLEDLMPFNERCVAEAIHRSKIPIISAVGHETDTSIADFVADVRAPTPSAAAEIAMGEKRAIIEGLQRVSEGMERALRQKIEHGRNLIRSAAFSRVISDPLYIVQHFAQRLDEVSCSLESKIAQVIERKQLVLQGAIARKAGLNPQVRLKEQQGRLYSIAEQLSSSMSTRLHFWSQKLTGMGQLLTSINPKKLLSRGYCIPFSQKTNSVMISTKHVKPGDGVRILMSDGSIDTKVETVNHDN